jgi:hypothetical protein
MRLLVIGNSSYGLVFVGFLGTAVKAMCVDLADSYSIRGFSSISVLTLVHMKLDKQKKFPLYLIQLGMDEFRIYDVRDYNSFPETTKKPHF